MTRKQLCKKCPHHTIECESRIYYKHCDVLKAFMIVKYAFPKCTLELIEKNPDYKGIKNDPSMPHLLFDI